METCGDLHPPQRELGSEFEDVWLAALDEAEIDPTDALLYTLDSESGNGYGARYLFSGTWSSTPRARA